MIGKTIGPYEVVAKVGEGGMGEVYRAKDTNLDRDVAIKVLPELFALDADRVARFAREAKTLASLNHPNIAGIYGIEASGAMRALVMELVAGEDLSAQIARGPIPLTDALPIAKQIADALEAAHEQGIIHRDLKPANVKVRADGTVKVLDFGLAKAMDPTAAASGDAMHSPTLTARATQMGMIIGTAAYMAPEQAKGKSVDKRADIWAFGVVLYEMVTGRRLFDAEDVSETLAAVLTRDVSVTSWPATIPPRLRTLVRDCLNRDPRQRLRDIGDARLVLDRIIAGAPDDAGAAPAATPALVAAWRRALPWAVAGALGVALVSALVVWAPWRSTPAPTPRRLLASIGADASLVTDRGAAAILSPDGTTLVFAALQEIQARLFIRKLDQLQAAPLAGTEGATYPFFSPDGQWIAFFAGGKLKKVSVTGGVAINLCDAEAGRGGTWADDETIIFSPTSGNSALLRVPAAGGKPAAFGTLSQGAVTQRWPQALPGGKAVLYTEHSAFNNFDGANVVVASVSAGASAKAGPSKVVVPGAFYGRYVPSDRASPTRAAREGGHLIYIQQGTLFAAPFDPERLETVGPAVPAIEGLASSASSGGAQVAFSSDGTLAYVPGEATSTAPIDWITRDGKTSVMRAAKSQWVTPRFSPDGQKIALDISDGKQRDIWVYDWARDSSTQLTFDAGSDTNPVWTPNSKRIVFASDRAKPGGARNLYWVNADGTGDVTRLSDSPDDERPMSWHPSGKFLGFIATRAGTGADLLILPMEGDGAKGWTAGTPTVFLGTPASEFAPMFSPDGRFIAYFSNEAAGGTAHDVYVRPFPGPGGKWRVSTNGGLFPRWSATTHELLFFDDSQVWSAPYSVVGDAFSPGKPQLWSPASIRGLATTSNYDLHPDGKRVAAAADQTLITVQDHVVLMSNFFDYLRTIAPGRN